MLTSLMTVYLEGSRCLQPPCARHPSRSRLAPRPLYSLQVVVSSMKEEHVEDEEKLTSFGPVVTSTALTEDEVVWAEKIA